MNINRDYRLTIPVMHCFDDRYAAPAAVAFLSLLEHGAKDCFFALYVVHLDIAEKHQEMLKEIVGRFPNASLEFVTPSNRVDRIFAQLDFKGHFSKEVLFKLTAADEFKQFTRMMIADVDVVYADDIAQIYERYLDDENYVVGHNQGKASIAWGQRYEERFYAPQFTEEERSVVRKGVNGCFLIFNLEAMRRDSVCERFIDFIQKNAYRLKQAEQDVINFVCAGKMSYLPLRAVACTYLWSVLADDEKPLWREAMEHPVQVHYALPEKPWRYPFVCMAHIWWECLSRTPFFYEVTRLLDVTPRKTNFSLFGKIPLFEVWHQGPIARVRFGGLIPMRRARSFWKRG